MSTSSWRQNLSCVRSSNPLRFHRISHRGKYCVFSVFSFIVHCCLFLFSASQPFVVNRIEFMPCRCLTIVYEFNKKKSIVGFKWSCHLQIMQANVTGAYLSATARWLSFELENTTIGISTLATQKLIGIGGWLGLAW